MKRYELTEFDKMNQSDSDHVYTKSVNRRKTEESLKRLDLRGFYKTGDIDFMQYALLMRLTEQVQGMYFDLLKKVSEHDASILSKEEVERLMIQSALRENSQDIGIIYDLEEQYKKGEF